MTLRLFAAITIPPAIADRLIPLQRGVHGASWRPRENLHVTLRFFGDVEDAVAHELDAELAAISASPFDMALKGAGWFGGERPHSLWVGADGGDALTSLAQKCDGAARRAGVVPERRRFSPHVTLAYLKSAGPEGAARFAERLGLFEAGPIRVKSFSVYSSWLGKGPSRYRLEAEYPLHTP